MSAVSKVLSAAIVGFEGALIEVESDTSAGLPSLQIVGLGNKAIDEAKERVRSAITNSLLEFPAKRITINLAPAEIPKDGTHYDLAIALAILVSSGQLRQADVDQALFAGELALDGSIRPVKGAVVVAEIAKQQHISTIFVPAACANQATLIEGVTVYPIHSLKEIFLHLKGESILTPHNHSTTTDTLESSLQTGPFLDDVYSQTQAKRALVIAAAGHHNLLLSGSPGAGKTMLAQILPNLLPTLTSEEQIAVTKLHSLAGTTETIIQKHPFRAPHHTASRVALIGGGSRSTPGDISLAHLGVLFLDELPEYPRSVLEALRQPLEDKYITISRANHHSKYPADFMLVATMNPCPCGYYGDSSRECTCTSTQILNYQKRLSGPFLDRIDLFATASRVPNNLLLHKEISKKQHFEATQAIQKARKIQTNRYNSSVKNNSNIRSNELSRYIKLPADAQTLLQTAADKLQLSARSYFKVIKIAQTIADLDNEGLLEKAHISEALQYRQTS